MSQILDLAISGRARAVAEQLMIDLPQKFPSMKVAVAFLAEAGVSYLEEVGVVKITPMDGFADLVEVAPQDEPDGRAINDEIAGPEARSDAKTADFQVRPHAQDTDFDVESNKKIPQSWMAKRGE